MGSTGCTVICSFFSSIFSRFSSELAGFNERYRSLLSFYRVFFSRYFLVLLDFIELWWVLVGFQGFCIYSGLFCFCHCLAHSGLSRFLIFGFWGVFFLLFFFRCFFRCRSLWESPCTRRRGGTRRNPMKPDKSERIFSLLGSVLSVWGGGYIRPSSMVARRLGGSH